MNSRDPADLSTATDLLSTKLYDSRRNDVPD